MARKKAPRRKPATLNRAVAFHRFHRVLRARWRVPARRRQHRTHRGFVETKARQDDRLHGLFVPAGKAANAAETAVRSSANGAVRIGARAVTTRSRPGLSGRSRIASRNASRNRRRERFRPTARPSERGADTARRTASIPLGRERMAKYRCWSGVPSLLAAARSALRRRRAASTNAFALDDGESLAATRAARGEHTAPAGRPHARAKTVHARTTAGFRLISALHGRVPSPAGNRANT
jgi:hypothetical protein